MSAMDPKDKGASNDVTPQRIMQMGWGYAPPLIIEAAVRNKIFDVLDGGAKTVAQVASATGCSERGLRAVMDALIGLNLLTKQGDRYSLTEESSQFLVHGKRSFQGGFFEHLSRQLIPSWLHLDESLKTGKPAQAVNQQSSGGDFFKEFVEALLPMNFPGAKGLADEMIPKIAANSETINVLDLAAGSGVWGIALAQASPKVRITAVDWPAVTPVTRAVAAKHGVGDRLRTVDGDLLKADFGSGYQLATLGHILHSEGRARSQQLLAKVHKALAPGGTIAIAEFILNDDRNGPVQPLIFAVNMLIHTDEGDAYTVPEMTQWLTAAGFKNVRQLQVAAPSPLLLATK